MGIHDWSIFGAKVEIDYKINPSVAFAIGILFGSSTCYFWTNTKYNNLPDFPFPNDDKKIIPAVLDCVQ